MNEEIKTPAANGKLSTIFLVVLGLHVAVIVAFIAYNLLKGNTESVPEVADVTTTQEAAPVAETAELPSPLPSLEIQANPLVETGMAAEETYNPMSMPSPADPIYSTNAVVQPRSLETVSTIVPAIKPVVAAGLGGYTVRKGDSLAKIARIHQTTVQELRAANGITGDMIRIGQALNIPGGQTALVSSPAKAQVVPVAAVVNAQVPVKTGFSEYTVVTGDTLWKIAKTFNTQPSQIAKLNGITDPSKLKVGSIIKVPTSSSQEASAPKAEPVRTNVQNTDVAMVPQAERQ